MHKFHYGYVKGKCEDELTETDSLCYQIHTKNIFAGIKEDENLFDFSDNSQNHPLYFTTNRKVIGKFKVGLNGELA